MSENRSIADLLRSAAQYPLPHHFFSRLVFRLMRIRTRFIKNFQIRAIARRYGVDLTEALSADPDAYPTFNDFFVRRLKDEARPIDPDPRTVVSPADSVVSQSGRISAGRIFQAKGRSYSLAELLGCDREDHPRAAPFHDGVFATLYLSPKDYHRVHMPFGGELQEMIHVPGRLFSVNPSTTRVVPRLFARNERVCAIFTTDTGPMAVVMVGALFVSAIETVWAGLVTPPAGRAVRAIGYRRGEVLLAKGAEMGRFNMGSTVIVLFGQDVAWDPDLLPSRAVKMGKRLGAIL